MLTCTDMNYLWLWMKIEIGNYTFFRQSMFQNRVHKTGCLSDLMIEHTTECSVILWFIHSSVQLFRRSAVQTFNCSDVQTD